MFRELYRESQRKDVGGCGSRRTMPPHEVPIEGPKQVIFNDFIGVLIEHPIFTGLVFQVSSFGALWATDVAPGPLHCTPRPINARNSYASYVYFQYMLS